ncbi:calcium/sodium antiporter [Fodinibius sp. AD559]|uniref:calcium/sodium antiporter n=1 Tax=Fodinibius sp. AD559 TaxID=3424179 RepID=UPI004046DC49
MTIFLFLCGLAFLIVGAEVLVRGASRIARGFGISPLIIGLTIVAFGTSSPELAVSVKSALSDQANIALGNVVGSNIFNVLFILGISALIVPLRVSQQLIRLDVPLMIGLSVIVLLFAMDQNISQYDGYILLAGLAGYIGFLIYEGRKNTGFGDSPSDQNVNPGKKDTGKNNWLLNIGFIAGGLVLLVIGSRWLVDGAVSFAQYLGVSELIIGLTIIAAGTSLPEVVTSIIAAIRGERDIAVGNVVGSNIFNIMGVLGIAGVVAPAGIEVSKAIYHFDIPIMIAVAFACLPIFFTGGTINRWEGGLLVCYYGAYTLYLVLAATEHGALPLFSTVMLYFVIPITAITIIIIAVQEWRNKGKSHVE